MNSKRAVLSLILIALVSSQWLVPSHPIIIARPVWGHAGHSTHGHSAFTELAPLQHPCCAQNDGAPSFHGDLCCGTVPALPSAIADLGSYTPYLSLIVVEPQGKRFISLAPPVHPPTL